MRCLARPRTRRVDFRRFIQLHVQPCCAFLPHLAKSKQRENLSELLPVRLVASRHLTTRQPRQLDPEPPINGQPHGPHLCPVPPLSPFPTGCGCCTSRARFQKPSQRAPHPPSFPFPSISARAISQQYGIPLPNHTTGLSPAPLHFAVTLWVTPSRSRSQTIS